MDEKKSAPSFLRDRDTWMRMLVNDPEMDHLAVRVGLHLALRMREDQRYCWPSIKTVSEEIGASPKGVSIALDRLCGYSKFANKKGKPDGRVYLNRSSRRNVGNMYGLIFPWA